VPAENFEHVIETSLREQASAEWEIGKSRRLRSGADATIVSYGALTSHALAAALLLAAEGLQVGVIDARFAKPVDQEMVKQVLRDGHVALTLEDHAIQNGFGSAVIECAVQNHLPTSGLTMLGMPDRLIGHATRKEQLAEVGLDAAGIAAAVRNALRQQMALQRTNMVREKAVRLPAI
jgi:1-deoxy-D-xylulose-5-phosphate synthase